MTRVRVRTWAARCAAFLLLSLGTVAVLALGTRIMERQNVMERRVDARMHRGLEAAGLLLADWLTQGREVEVAAYIGQRERDGTRMTLFDTDLNRLAGAEPLASTMQRVRKVREGKAPEEEPPMPLPDDEVPLVIDHVLAFTGPDQGRYIIASTDLVPAPPPGPRPIPWSRLLRFLCIGLVVAFLLMLVISPRLDRPAKEFRSAFRRLARGDMEVRLDTPRSQGEVLFRELADEFNATVESLSERQQAQRMLVYGLSHDMRSPLARMALAVDTALDRSDADAIQLLRRLRKDTDQLHDLVASMVRMMREEEGRNEPGVVDMEMLARDLGAAYGRDSGAGDKGVELQTVGPGPWRVEGYPDQLRSMLENVLANAVRHTAQGTTVQVGLEQAEGRVRITVEDHGPGVPEETLAEIFQPFYSQGRQRWATVPGAGEGLDEKLESARACACPGLGQGLGLGLAIARHVAHAHGGTIQADNRQGGGLAVTMELPFAPA